jgi:hypothetical protein
MLSVLSVLSVLYVVSCAGAAARGIIRVSNINGKISLRMMQMSQTRRALIWAAMALIVAVLCVLGFRGYLSAEMLLNFANAFYC